jgi:hypothetical protein
MKRTARRTAWVLFLAAALCLPGGCATAKKKFIRKRAEPVVRPVVYTQDEDFRQYSNKYHYTTHFTYWKTWHSEFLATLGENAKREERAAEEAIGHLEGMSHYLLEPKKGELEAQIAILRQVLSGLRTRGSQTFVSKLERVYRVVNTNFSYERVKAFIAPDDVDLGAPSGAPAPAGAPVPAETPATASPS